MVAIFVGVLNRLVGTPVQEVVDVLGFTDIAEETCGVDFVLVEPFNNSL